MQMATRLGNSPWGPFDCTNTNHPFETTILWVEPAMDYQFCQKKKKGEQVNSFHSAECYLFPMRRGLKYFKAYLLESFSPFSTTSEGSRSSG